MPVNLLPYCAAEAAEGEAGYSAKESGDRNERKEVPESPNEIAALELRAEVLPGERCSADEAEQKRAVRRDVLDGGATQLIELRLNGSSRADWCCFESSSRLQSSRQMDLDRRAVGKKS